MPPDTPDRPLPGSPADWLRHVQSDLTLARIDPRPGLLLESLCYHAQQAAEKALKTVFLHATGGEPPRTHDVRVLLDLLRAQPVGSLPLTDEEAEQLTGYAILTRYPADLGEIEEDEWLEAVSLAEKTAAWAAAAIASPRQSAQR